MRVLKAAGWLLGTCGLIGVLAGCASTVVVDSAPHPEAPQCARVMLNMPEKMGDFTSRETSSQATAAWGDPTAAIFKCGMDTPAATTDPCVSVNGVDWISTQQDKKTWRFVTFGRKPAAEVLVDPTKLSGSTVLASLSDAAGMLPKTAGKCVGQQDLKSDGTPATPTAK